MDELPFLVDWNDLQRRNREAPCRGIFKFKVGGRTIVLEIETQ